MRPLLAALLAVSAAACGAPSPAPLSREAALGRASVRAQAARLLSCPEADLEVEPVREVRVCNAYEGGSEGDLVAELGGTCAHWENQPLEPGHAWRVVGCGAELHYTCGICGGPLSACEESTTAPECASLLRG